MTKAIIFDCFGVVIGDALQVMRDELAQTDQAGADRVSELVRQSNRGLIGAEETNELIAAAFGVAPESYLRRKAEGEVKNQALLDYIAGLRKDYKTAMLSNVSGGGLLRRFEAEELDKYFDVTVASAEIGFAKPEPEAYETVCYRLDVRLDESIFIDDREVYCEGARAVGMRAILYEDFARMKRDLKKLLADPER